MKPYFRIILHFTLQTPFGFGKENEGAIFINRKVSGVVSGECLDLSRVFRSDPAGFKEVKVVKTA